MEESTVNCYKPPLLLHEDEDTTKLPPLILPNKASIEKKLGRVRFAQDPTDGAETSILTMNSSDIWKETSHNDLGMTKSFIKNVDSFHNEMKLRIKSLKSHRSSSTPAKTIDRVDDNFGFIVLKQTPEYKSKLDTIKKFQEDIETTINNYKTERAERIEIQKTMCREIKENKMNVEKNVELFLNLCKFEEETENNDNENDDIEEEEEKKFDKDKQENNEKQVKNMRQATFIKKNILRAKEGIMANFSLTDEEKLRLESLLIELESTGKVDDENSNDKKEKEDILNAYAFNAEEDERMKQLNVELEKYGEKKTVDASEINITDETFWKKFVIDQSLKEIDAKLQKLRQIDTDEEIKQLKSEATPSEEEEEAANESVSGAESEKEEDDEKYEKDEEPHDVV